MHYSLNLHHSIDLHYSINLNIYLNRNINLLNNYLLHFHYPLNVNRLLYHNFFFDLHINLYRYLNLNHLWNLDQLNNHSLHFHRPIHILNSFNIFRYFSNRLPLNNPFLLNKNRTLQLNNLLNLHLDRHFPHHFCNYLLHSLYRYNLLNNYLPRHLYKHLDWNFSLHNLLIDHFSRHLPFNNNFLLNHNLTNLLPDYLLLQIYLYRNHHNIKNLRLNFHLLSLLRFWQIFVQSFLLILEVDLHFFTINFITNITYLLMNSCIFIKAF